MRMWIIRVIVGLVALLTLALIFSLEFFKCDVEGVNGKQALAIANERLLVKFDKHRLERNFKLEKYLQDDQLNWSFYYRAEECSVIIIVDSCGVADIGGMSLGCQ